MNRLIYSATEARSNFFDILNLVYSGKNEIIITKDRKPVVRLIKEKTNTMKKKNNLISFAGIMSKKEANVFYEAIKDVRKAPSRGTPIKYDR